MVDSNRSYDGFETKTATALEVIQTGHMTGLKLDCDSFRSDSNRSYDGFETKTDGFRCDSNRSYDGFETRLRQL